MKKFVTVFVYLLVSFLIFPGQVLGYFDDGEVLVGARIETGVIDLTLRSGQSNFVPGADYLLRET